MEIEAELEEPFQSSGSEYRPSEDEVDEKETDDEMNEMGTNDEVNEIETIQVENKRFSNSTSDNNDSLTVTTALDQNHMVVSASSGKSKQVFCMFCGKFQSKYARHLLRKHKDEEKVKEIVLLKPGDPTRKKLIDSMRKESQFAYNTNESLNKGDLLVSKRPSAKLQRTGKHYTVCPRCKGFYTKNNIRHHAKNCFDYRGTKNKNLFALGRKLIARIHPEASETLKTTIFPVMRDDIVVNVLRYDRLIIMYGNKMCAKYRLQHQHDLIRSNLRVLGRFLMSIKSLNEEITEMASIYDPQYYDDVIRAINDVAGFDEEKQQYRAPSTAYNLGSLVKKIAQLRIVDCIKRKSPQEKQNAEDFLKLLLDDITVTVNKTVIETQTQQKRRKNVNLPLVEDIKKLRDYLNKNITNGIEKLNSQFSYQDWIGLSEATLISIQLFNRRRAGECERIFIEDYQNHSGIDNWGELSPKSRKLAKNYVRFEIRGKLNRTVPVLLSRLFTESIETILKFRKDAGVPEKNRFVFGIPGGNKQRFKYIRSCVLMRKFSTECGAKMPDTLRGTTLRKHVATECINLDLSETEVKDVASFMGHSAEIHKSHYRQPIIRREILRMSEVLEKAQGVQSDDSDESSNENDINEAHSQTGGNFSFILLKLNFISLKITQVELNHLSVVEVFN